MAATGRGPAYAARSAGGPYQGAAARSAGGPSLPENPEIPENPESATAARADKRRIPPFQARLGAPFLAPQTFLIFFQKPPCAAPRSLIYYSLVRHPPGRSPMDAT